MTSAEPGVFRPPYFLFNSPAIGLLQELPQDIAKELAATAKAIASPGKGILAADESTGSPPHGVSVQQIVKQLLSILLIILY